MVTASGPAPAWPDEATVRAHQPTTGPFTATGQFPDHRSPFPLMPGAIAHREDAETLLDGYDAALRYIDEKIGEVLDRLEGYGLLGDTAVIVSADHGDAFGEHGIYSDHVCADECVHHVPLIVRWPGMDGAQGVHAGFHYNTDLAPTICDLLGLPIPRLWDGGSFAETLRSGKATGRDVLVWDHGLYTVQRAVRTERWLFVVTYDDYGYESFDPVALYDMKEDPYQTTNVAADHPEVIARSWQHLALWEHEQMQADSSCEDPLAAILSDRRSAGFGV